MAESEFGGRVAVVTGAGSGIGEACARLLADRGARVVVADRDAAEAKRVAGQIGQAALPFAVEVTDPAACEAMVRAAVEAFGRLDVAVNNAGIGGPRAATGQYPLDGWDSVLAVNLTGVFYSMRAEIPALLESARLESARLESGGGSIVNVASILGSVGFPGSSAYVAAKHGVVGLTKTAALEYAREGLRVNSVGPGFIQTPMLHDAPAEALVGKHPLGRLGRPEEVAELVAFLASDRSGNTTGAYLLSDGGYTAQ